MRKAESRKQKWISDFAFRAVCHRREDGDLLRRFVFQLFGESRLDGTFFTKELKPKQGFVGLLDRAAQFGDKLHV